MRSESDQRGEETEKETGMIWCQQSAAQKQQPYSKLTLQSLDSTGKAVCTFWRIKHSKVHFWGTPSFASFKLGLFFNLLIPNCSQSLDFSSSLETLELLMQARKHILLQSEEYLYSVSNTNRRFKYCSSGVFVRKGKQSERKKECMSVCRVVIGCAYERMRILCELVLHKCVCVWQTLHSHRVFPVLSTVCEQQAVKTALQNNLELFYWVKWCEIRVANVNCEPNGSNWIG